jgi:ribonuclease HIII
LETVKISPDKLLQVKELLLQHPSAKLLDSTSPYEAFRIGCLDGLVVGYTSGKIVSNTPATTQFVSDAIRTVPVEADEYSVTLGSDEAGKGEWLGPMTIAAVAVSPQQSTLLSSKGVMDSKQLSTSRISELAEVVRVNSISSHVVTIPPERFNEFFKEVKDEGKGLNDMLAWGHAKAIESAYNNLPTKYLLGKIKVVIDEFDRLKTERQLRKVLDLKEIVLVQYPKAEEDNAVAAASILARAAWETWIDNQAQWLHVNLRGLSPSDAKNNPLASRFAKMSYLNSRRLVH